MIVCVMCDMGGQCFFCRTNLFSYPPSPPNPPPSTKQISSAPPATVVGLLVPMQVLAPLWVCKHKFPKNCLHYCWPTSSNACCVVLCCVVLCCVVLCCVVLCCVVLCCVVLCCVVLCCVVLCVLCCVVLCCFTLCCVVLGCVALWHVSYLGRCCSATMVTGTVVYMLSPVSALPLSFTDRPDREAFIYGLMKPRFNSIDW